jgi:hypothetical protein
VFAGAARLAEKSHRFGMGCRFSQLHHDQVGDHERAQNTEELPRSRKKPRVCASGETVSSAPTATTTVTCIRNPICGPKSLGARDVIPSPSRCDRKIIDMTTPRKGPSYD